MRNRLPELLASADAAIKSDIVIEQSLAGKAAELLLRTGFAGKQLAIVCDKATREVLGDRILRETASFKPDIVMLKGTPHPDAETVQYLRGHACDAFIAVGSGTINDLCKCASFLDNKPYAVFPTAASMNGYLSANASITSESGQKQSMPAHLPRGVFCDLAIIANAPRRLTLSGLGDSLCRPTAQADWLLSHLLLDTPYSALPFALLVPYERELFRHPDKLANGDTHVIELLVKTLLVSGIGMTIAKGSYPASEGEHLIAHTMHMKHGAALPQTYHGEEVGVTTLTMAKIQEEMLSHPLRLRPRPHWDKAIAAYFGAKLAPAVTEASRAKQLLLSHHEEISARLKERRDAIRDALANVALPEAHLRDVLVRAGAPTSPADLNWNERDYELAVSHARFIRDRFTFLDLL